MKKKFRIRKNSEFKKIRNVAKFKKNRYIVIYYIDKKLDHSRFGISISKKIGNSVVRNKIKRQIKNIVSLNLDFKELKYDYLFYPRKDYKDNEFNLMSEQILNIMKEIGK